MKASYNMQNSERNINAVPYILCLGKMIETELRKIPNVDSDLKHIWIDVMFKLQTNSKPVRGL